MVHNPNKRIRQSVHLEAVILGGLQVALHAFETPLRPVWLLTLEVRSGRQQRDGEREDAQGQLPWEKAPEALHTFKSIIVLNTFLLLGEKHHNCFHLGVHAHSWNLISKHILTL